jgi:oligoribonuclease NrnB/cAMP/cGMP phosphodiesterase (DHH superfamily)
MNKRADVCIFHSRCPDGFTSAFVLYVGGLIGKNTVLRPDVPSASQAPEVSGHVIVVDVAYSPSVLQSVIDQSESVVYIDHHITQIDEIKEMDKHNPKLTVIYDIKECGSTLAWKYCFPSEPLPLYLRIIRDNDNGYWKMAESITRPFLTAFETDFNMDPNIASLKKLKILLTEEGMKDTLTKGRYYYRYRNHMVQRAMKYSTTLKWGKYRVAFINISGAIASETATRIAREYPSLDFVVSYHYNISKKIFVYSMRSDTTRKHPVDVQEIAKRYGGGGHTGAASFADTVTPDVLVGDNIQNNDGQQIGGNQESCRDGHHLASFESSMLPLKLVLS